MFADIFSQDVIGSANPGCTTPTGPSLASWVEALDDAQLRSYNSGPQVVTIVTGRRHLVIRRFEDGREARPGAAVRGLTAS